LSKSSATIVGATLVRLALVSTAACSLAGCDTVSNAVGSVGGVFSHPDPDVGALGAGVNPRQVSGKPSTNPSEKQIVKPVASQDINCPDVTIGDGAAALRVGGPENASVRYQFSIGDTARQCDPAGPGQAALKIGVAGEVVIGPAGSAGTFSAPLKITVTKQGDKTPVFSQTYRVQATTDGVSAGQFRIVTDRITVPMTTLQLADVYSITVGFENGAGGPSPTGRKGRRRNAG
jgi:hypothetical protein